MRFKLDENIPTELADFLKASGYETDTVADEGLKGTKDKSIAEVCEREERTLVTFDLDFSDIREFPPEKYSGLLVLRLIRQDPEFLLLIFREVLPLLEQEPVGGRLWIIEENRVRIRDAL